MSYNIILLSLTGKYRLTDYILTDLVEKLHRGWVPPVFPADAHLHLLGVVVYGVYSSVGVVEVVGVVGIVGEVRAVDSEVYSEVYSV
jgi:hypothetical protein